MIKIETLHHVSVPVRVMNLETSKEFYEGVLGLKEIERPNFDFPGAWYELGDCQLHLIEDIRFTSTFREGKIVDSRDVHFAIRVNSYEETREFLRSQGYRPDAKDELYKTRESPDNPTPWQQLFIMDPDRNIIELNAARPGS